MTRRRILFTSTATGICVLAAMMAAQPGKEGGKLLVLEWANKSSMPTPPAAVLVEFGMKDPKPVDWSGRATVTGAKVVHREGYCFRPGEGDKLLDPDAWEASSHRPLRGPRKNPVINKMLGMSAVGVVLHLAELQDDAALTVEPKDAALGKATVPLKDVLAGKPQPIWDGRVRVRLITTATPLATGKTEDDFPAACYGPDGTLWVAYQSYRLRDPSRTIEQQALQKQPENFDFLDHPEFADQLFVRYYRDGEWGKPIAVTDDKQDLMGCSVAVEASESDSGIVQVRYSRNRNGRFEVYRRHIQDRNQVSEESRQGAPLPFPSFRPVSCTTSAGQARGTSQGLTPAGPEIHDSSMSWRAACAAGLGGEIAIASDSYIDGDYDVQITTFEGQTGAPIRGWFPAASSKFEARPSIAYGPQGRLWIAYEEGPELWGKDYGALDDEDGQPLYSSRSVRVVCIVDGKLMKPAAELPTSQVKPPDYPYAGQAGPSYEHNTDRYAYPKIGIDGKGRVWLTYRQKFGTRYSTHPGSYWLTFARRLDGDTWSEPIEVHHSDGMLDHRPVLLPHKSGGLLIVHNTDGRYTTPDTINNDIYLSYIDLPGEPVEPKLVPHEPGTKDPKLVERARKEQEAVDRIRAYRIDHGGKKLRLLRGEYHRHTEISWDGGPDGSLEDMFRYAIDAAQFDWIGNGDHDNGAGREYTWWLTQKFSDAYHVPGKFTPMFTYERSVSYPHGHRNVMFARRGIMTLPRLAAANDKERVAGVHADDTKMLYRYLKQFDGICAAHTSATGMGTDWRDNDPQVEPVVEIYQGDRMSYEKQGAPRAGVDPQSGEHPPNLGGWRPLGFVDLALRDKGYKLGFQASSDHWSTHISYFVVLAPENSRAAILEAVKKRHCYGATDDIICDVRCGGHIMGDAFELRTAPKLQIKVIGTGPLEKIDVLRDSDVVATLEPEGIEFAGEWTDPDPPAGEHYYYVRVLQKDQELAWTSPMWVTYRK